MFITRIFHRIKRAYKMNMFKKNASCGKNLNVSHDAFLRSSSKDKVVIGSNCDLCCRIYVVGEGSVSIGDFSTIRYASVISSAIGIEIGNYSMISNNVTIYDHNSHPTDPQRRMEMCKAGFYGPAWSPNLSDKKRVVIEDNCWVGEGATILKGVRIGKGSIVATKAVVTKDVPPYCVVAGNPAKVVKHLEGYQNED